MLSVGTDGTELEGQWYKMINVLGHDSELHLYTGQGTTWANEMNFGMAHAPGAGSIAT